MDGETVILELGGHLPAGIETWTLLPRTPKVVANPAPATWTASAQGWRIGWQQSEYFSGLPLLVRPDQREHFAMDGRTRRPPRDRFNALLSFLYAMWMNDCRSALEAAGLDPQVGFLHALRPGRAALALDLMEEFRPWADRLALTLINRGQVQADDFDLREGGGVTLQGDARKAVVVAYQERKKDEITHPLLAQSLPLGLVPLVQARLLARALRDDAMPYLPFVPK